MPPAAKPKGISDAMFRVQSDVPSIQKDKINPAFQSRYVSLDKVLETVLPVLKANGILLTQMPSSIGGGVPALTTAFTHVDTGEEMVSTMPLVLQQSTPQGQGSALTYAKRYAILSSLGLTADADDDAQSAQPSGREALRKSAGVGTDYDIAPSL